MEIRHIPLWYCETHTPHAVLDSHIAFRYTEWTCRSNTSVWRTIWRPTCYSLCRHRAANLRHFVRGNECMSGTYPLVAREARMILCSALLQFENRQYEGGRIRRRAISSRISGIQRTDPPLRWAYHEQLDEWATGASRSSVATNIMCMGSLSFIVFLHILSFAFSRVFCILFCEFFVYFSLFIRSFRSCDVASCSCCAQTATLACVLQASYSTIGKFWPCTGPNLSVTTAFSSKSIDAVRHNSSRWEKCDPRANQAQKNSHPCFLFTSTCCFMYVNAFEELHMEMIMWTEILLTQCR